jgi:uncharacterized protein (TIGR02271 family)
LEREERTDRFTAVEDQYAGYTVYDRDGDKVGKVDDLFVDESDQPEYIGVKMGFFGTRSTLIPMDIVTVDEQNESMMVNEEKSRIKDGPNFDDDHEITPDFERQVHEYFGLRGTDGARGSYGDYYDDDFDGAGTTGNAGPGMAMGDRPAGGGFREHDPANEGATERGDDDLEDQDELRVQRSEEELRAGTREREAGAMRVRKRVRTDRERLEVPVRHEEVTVERVPVSGEATGAQIGEDEVAVPVTEEEVVTDKRAVAKEEIRVRKDAVEDTEVVEEDVRREEVDIDDETTGRRGV